METFGSNQPPIPGETTSAIPPPPLEVNIRTMASDLRSAGTMGGEPKFERVPVVSSRITPKTGSSFHIPNRVLLIVGVTVFLGIMGTIIYVIYPFVAKIVPTDLFGSQPPATTLPPPSPQPRAVLPPPPPTPVLPQATFHQSFLKTPADQKLTYTFGVPVTNVSDLEPAGKKILGMLTKAPSAPLYEIEARDPNGNAFPLRDFFGEMQASIMESSFLTNTFSPDFTFFVLKDRGNFWPGYVLELRADKNQSSASTGVAAIETAKEEAWLNLFLTSPGVPIGNFHDAQINGNKVRELNFKTSGAALVYGWYKNYLVIATSEAGYKTVITKL